MSPGPPLFFDYEMYGYAKCFAEESGTSGNVGHVRDKCRTMDKGYGECCSYGYGKGKNIILQLLIDEGISNLGHRKICLSDWFTSVGVSIADHKIWEKCAVLDFKLESISKQFLKSFPESLKPR